MILALEAFTMKSEYKICTCELTRNNERKDRVKHKLCSVDGADA